MVVIKLIKVLVIISIFLAAFFPIYINVSVFALEQVGFQKTSDNTFLNFEEVISEYSERREIFEMIEDGEKQLELHPSRTYLYEGLALLYDRVEMYDNVLR
ncbi:MAG: hypothetical protein ABH848_03110 [Candidatus Omnitrophota bacterium]